MSNAYSRAYGWWLRGGAPKLMHIRYFRGQGPLSLSEDPFRLSHQSTRFCALTIERSIRPCPDWHLRHLSKVVEDICVYRMIITFSQLRCRFARLTKHWPLELQDKYFVVETFPVPTRYLLVRWWGTSNRNCPMYQFVVQQARLFHCDVCRWKVCKGNDVQLAAMIVCLLWHELLHIKHFYELKQK